ncbi:hypothetical protein FB451DRAFT_1446947 [Mycena latifolia]|nr:hypothetical protein FB451DRAFT_1446947 [Mycena latifolia]
MTEPILPPELERQIFEMASRWDPDYPETVLNVAAVAQRAFEWTKPSLRVVCFPGDDGLAAALVQHIDSGPNSGLLRTAVRRVWLERAASPAVALRLLELSTNIIDLVLIGAFCKPDVLRIVSGLELRRLSCVLWHLFGSSEAINLATALFASVTHLDIADSVEHDKGHIFAQLRGMKALTHLAFSDPELSAVSMQQILSARPGGHAQLEVVVILFEDNQEGITRAREFAQELAPADLRLVITVVPYRDKDWKVGTRGGADFWKQAEELVSRQSAILRRGEPPESLYWMDYEEEQASTLADSSEALR